MEACARTCVKLPPVQILMLAANIHTRTLNEGAGNGSPAYIDRV